MNYQPGRTVFTCRNFMVWTPTQIDGSVKSRPSWRAGSSSATGCRLGFLVVCMKDLAFSTALTCATSPTFAIYLHCINVLDFNSNSWLSLSCWSPMICFLPPLPGCTCGSIHGSQPLCPDDWLPSITTLLVLTLPLPRMSSSPSSRPRSKPSHPPILLRFVQFLSEHLMWSLTIVNIFFLFWLIIFH